MHGLGHEFAEVAVELRRHPLALGLGRVGQAAGEARSARSRGASRTTRARNAAAPKTAYSTGNGRIERNRNTDQMVPEEGLEPPTRALRMRCSTN